MTRVEPIGFFRELEHGIPDGPSLREACRDAAAPDEDRLVAYLRAGTLYIATPGTVVDVLAPTRTNIGSPHILTDGRWAWPADLAHYVATYHVRLPDEFVAHAAANRWLIPADIDVRALSLG